jgi:hypothetical protein
MSEGNHEEFAWHEQHEHILKRWSEIGASYRYLHDKSMQKFNTSNMRFTIPVIVISTITGTASFALSSMPLAWQPIAPSIIGGLNLVAGLVSTISQFLRVSELLAEHRSASIAFGKFSRTIAVELSLPVVERGESGHQFIAKMRTELDRLLEQSPAIPNDIINKFSKRFKNTVFTKPEILEIRAVDVFRSKAVEELITEKATELATRSAEEKTKNEIQLTDVNHGISDMLTSFRLAADDRKVISKGTGKKKLDTELETVIDEMV